MSYLLLMMFQVSDQVSRKPRLYSFKCWSAVVASGECCFVLHSPCLTLLDCCCRGVFSSGDVLNETFRAAGRGGRGGGQRWDPLAALHAHYAMSPSVFCCVRVFACPFSPRRFFRTPRQVLPRDVLYPRCVLCRRVIPLEYNTQSSRFDITSGTLPNTENLVFLVTF